MNPDCVSGIAFCLKSDPCSDCIRAERDRLLLKVGEMQEAIDGIAPYVKVKYGMPEEAVNAIERLSFPVTEKEVEGS